VTAQKVDVQTLRGNKLSVEARCFVLATGGIENTRLLLTSNKQAPAGLGNGNDLVGRYFMDHPRVTSAWVRLRPEWRRNKLYDNKFQYQNDAVAAYGTRIAAQLSPTPAAQERYGILTARASLGSIFPGEYGPAADASGNSGDSMRAVRIQIRRLHRIYRRSRLTRYWQRASSQRGCSNLRFLFAAFG